MKTALIIAAILAFFAIGYVVSYYIFNDLLFKAFFARVSKKNDLEKTTMAAGHYLNVREEVLAAKDRLERYENVRKVTVTSYDGWKLSARYFDAHSKTTIILVHGFHSVPMYNFSVVAEEHLKRGMNVLMTDMRAHGESEGEYCTYGLKEGKDLLNWIAFAESAGAEKVVLHGISTGAAAVAFSSDGWSDSVKCAIFDCGFNSASELCNYIVETRHLPGFIFLGYIDRRTKRRVGLDTVNDRAEDRLKKAFAPIFFVIGGKDDVAPFESFKKCYDACASEKQMYIAENAGHTTALVEDLSARKAYFEFIEKHI